MKHLKVLRLNCHLLPAKIPLDVLAKENVPIEELELTDFTFDSNIADNLMKLGHVKQLKFSYGNMAASQLVRAAKAMPHLNALILHKFGRLGVIDIKKLVEVATELKKVELTGQREIKIDENDFNSILNSVKNRENKNKLKLQILGSQCYLDVKEDTIEENIKWLKVGIYSDY